MIALRTCRVKRAGFLGHVSIVFGRLVSQPAFLFLQPGILISTWRYYQGAKHEAIALIRVGHTRQLNTGPRENSTQYEKRKQDRKKKQRNELLLEVF